MGDRPLSLKSCNILGFSSNIFGFFFFFFFFFFRLQGNLPSPPENTYDPPPPPLPPRCRKTTTTTRARINRRPRSPPPSHWYAKRKTVCGLDSRLQARLLGPERQEDRRTNNWVALDGSNSDAAACRGDIKWRFRGVIITGRLLAGQFGTRTVKLRSEQLLRQR